jgi:hypothetical protein
MTIPSCPNFPSVTGTFDDNYQDQGFSVPSSQDQAECMQRAQDYYQWCGSSVAETASFLSNGVVVQTVSYPPSSGSGPSISVTDPNYNGGDTAVCSGSGHDDVPAIQSALDYASANAIPTVTIPAGSTCYLNSTQYKFGIAVACYSLDIPSNVTLQGQGNVTINDTPMSPSDPCFGNKGGVFNFGNWGYWIFYNGAYPTNPANGKASHDGSGGYFAQPTTQSSNTISFITPGDENNFALGDFVALFEQQPMGAAWGTANPCDDVCAMQPNKVTGVDTANHAITVQDPLVHSHSAPWIDNVTCGKGNAGACTMHDMGLQNLTINAVDQPFIISESWGITMDGLTFNIKDPGGEWGVNTAEHWSFTNSTLTYDRQGGFGFQETHQRDSGHVLWQNVTLQALPGTGGWVSIGCAEYTFNITYDNVTLPSLYPDPSGTQQGAVVMGGIYNTMKNSTITMNGDFNATNVGCGIVIDTDGDERGFDGFYTFQNNTINGTANGGGMIAVTSASSSNPSGYIISGNTLNIGSGGAGTFGIANSLGGGFTMDGNINPGSTTGSGVFVFNGGASSCAVTNNTGFGTYATGACTQSNNQ